MAKSSRKRAYFGLGFVASLILTIIPFCHLVCSVITRAERKNWLGVILNIFACPVFWFIDLITILAYKDVTILA